MGNQIRIWNTLLAFLSLSLQATDSPAQSHAPLKYLKKDDEFSVHPQFLKLSPYERNCYDIVSYPLSNGSYLIVPKCSPKDRYDAGKNLDASVTYFHGARDTWELGPIKPGMDALWKATRTSQHEFIVYLRKMPKMKGTLGTIHRLLSKPRWIEGEWEKGEDYACRLDTNTNTYISCENHIPEKAIPKNTVEKQKATMNPPLEKAKAPKPEKKVITDCDDEDRFYFLEEAGLREGMDLDVARKILNRQGLTFLREPDCDDNPNQLCSIYIMTPECIKFQLWVVPTEGVPSGLSVESLN